jgi:uncharacterized sulfatase
VTNAFSAGAVLATALFGAVAPAAAQQPARPNILWISSEDHGPHMGCYGDPFAVTPNVDRLAARGLRYTRVWSNAPVCAPARTTLIAAMYAHSTGGEHMRSLVPFPAGLQMFPQLLRAAGYYCTNNAKEDYNLAKPGKVWDESSKKAHYKNRESGQPFFADFNSEKSHESRLRIRPHKPVHDPAKVRIPAYHPDTPEVRQDWAQYYDTVTAADADAGARLQELEDAGLAADTIVFYFADHGSGMPRNKRWPYNSGLHVPLVVYIPEKWRALGGEDYKPGGTCDRLVSFVDFGKTVLSLAGVKPPEWMQGHAFLGKFTEPAPPVLHGFRGRMDERYDMVRSATDGRYVYIRNYMPHVIYGRRLDYMFQTPTTKVWKRHFDEGRLNAAQSIFWKTKPPEELYDLKADPDEVHNLAGAPELREVQARLRQAQQDLARRIRDVGFLPEGERFARGPGKSPYDLAREPAAYSFDKVFAAAEAASMPGPAAEMKTLLADGDSSVRWWGAMGLLMRGRAGVESAGAELRAALADRSTYVRIVAAEALGRYGDDGDLRRVLLLLADLSDVDKNDVFTAMAALDVLDILGEKAAPAAGAIKALSTKARVPDPRYSPYVPRLLGDLQERWK